MLFAADSCDLPVQHRYDIGADSGRSVAQHEQDAVIGAADVHLSVRLHQVSIAGIEQVCVLYLHRKQPLIHANQDVRRGGDFISCCAHFVLKTERAVHQMVLARPLDCLANRARDANSRFHLYASGQFNRARRYIRQSYLRF